MKVMLISVRAVNRWLATIGIRYCPYGRHAVALASFSPGMGLCRPCNRLRGRRSWKPRVKPGRSVDTPPNIRIGKHIFLRGDKAPYVPSGESLQGVIEVAENGDLVCHECGAQTPNLGGHVRTHEMSARDYKVKHGLPVSISLLSDGQSDAMARRAKKQSAEYYHALSRIGHSFLRNVPRTDELARFNLTRHCKAQVLADLSSLATTLGRTPSIGEMAAAGLRKPSIERSFGLSLEEVIKVAGLGPMPVNRKGNPGPRYTKPQLIELIRAFVRTHDRIPAGRDCVRGLFPSLGTLRKYFGSTRQACTAAGFGHLLVRRQKAASHPASYSDAELMDRLYGFAAQHLRFPSRRDFGKGKLPSDQTYANHFGSLQATRVLFWGRVEAALEKART